MFPCVPINKEWKAIIYTETNLNLVKELIGEPLNKYVQEFKGLYDKYLLIPTIRRTETVNKYDVILKDNSGEILVMTEDEYKLIFKSISDG